MAQPEGVGRGVHNRDKYPEIWVAFERAKQKKLVLQAKRRPVLDLMDDKFRAIEALRGEVEVLAQGLEGSAELAELSKEISRLARAMGAKGVEAVGA